MAIKKFGIKDITEKQFAELGLIDVLDEQILTFKDLKTIRGVSKQHANALHQRLCELRNMLADDAGLRQIKLKPLNRRVL